MNKIFFIMGKNKKADKRLAEAKDYVKNVQLNRQGLKVEKRPATPKIDPAKVGRNIVSTFVAESCITYTDIRDYKNRVFRKGQLLINYGNCLIGSVDGRMGLMTSLI